jgi:hypothetical protein
MVAPYSFDHIPTPNRFEAVECLDISKRGIAYLTPTRPTWEMVVITTGEAPDLVYRTARIVSVQEMPADEAPGFRVGCEFIGRLSRHLF